MATSEQAWMAKMKQLPPQRMAEVEDFIDFLHAREGEQRLAHAAARVSEPSFVAVWDNDEDAAYDRICAVADASKFNFFDVDPIGGPNGR